jgi:hypothetical protein
MVLQTVVVVNIFSSPRATHSDAHMYSCFSIVLEVHHRLRKKDTSRKEARDRKKLLMAERTKKKEEVWRQCIRIHGVAGEEEWGERERERERE